jgi:manganese/zinc/iron transport system permease protein
VLFFLVGSALGTAGAGGGMSGSIADRSMNWPSAAEWARVLLLKDYNTRIVVGGTALLGVAAGIIGSFTLLRKRALMGDALSHAMLPGIGLAFMFSVSAGGTGKALPVLLAGATVSGLLGLGFILLIRKFTRLKEDTALGVVLSVFFGAGVAVLGVVQRMGQGHAAGLESFIYGKTASMVATDAGLIAAAAGLVIVICTLLFKEFKLLCFDAEYAAALGWPTVLLDVIMMGLVVAVTVIGLQAVGLILMIALLIIPAAAARFWTEKLRPLVFISAAIGAVSAGVGSAASALLPNLPSGAMIVLVGAIFFALSMMFGRQRGVLIRLWGRRKLGRKVRRQHLLRAAYEILETEAVPPGRLEGNFATQSVALKALLKMRSWSLRELRHELQRAVRDGLIQVGPNGCDFYLTPTGFGEATRMVRNHRLWELYLITHADIAPSHVDRDADAIEHALGPDMVRKLESLLVHNGPQVSVPASPHALAVAAQLPGGAPR